MSYVVLSPCIGSSLRQDPLIVLNRKEKRAVVTDVALVSLALVASVVMLLQINGLVNLGSFSNLCAFPGVAYALLGGGVLAAVADMVKVIVKQQKISRLKDLRHAMNISIQQNSSETWQEKVNTLKEEHSEQNKQSERRYSELQQEYMAQLSNCQQHVHSLRETNKKNTTLLQVLEATSRDVEEQRSEITSLQGRIGVLFQENKQLKQKPRELTFEDVTTLMEKAMDVPSQKKIEQLKQQSSDLRTLNQRLMEQIIQLKIEQVSDLSLVLSELQESQ